MKSAPIFFDRPAAPRYIFASSQSRPNRVFTKRNIFLVVSGAFLAVAALWALSNHYWFGINLSQSLPYKLVIIEKNAHVQRGDYVVFNFEGTEIAGRVRGMPFFKRIAGVSGDVVSHEYRNIKINGVDVGRALTKTSEGESLNLISDTTIPDGMYYVQATHDMSFDSRYRQCGLIASRQIIGKAHIVF